MALKHSHNKVLAFPRRAKHARHARWQPAVSSLDARVSEIERRLAVGSRSAAAANARMRLRTALIGSLLFHVVLIYGVAFKTPKPPVIDNGVQLEVVLVNAQSKTAPPTPDAFAQHNLDGGGNTDQKRRAASPLPVLPDQKADADVKLALKKVETLERQAKELMTQSQAPVAAETVAAAPKPEPKTQPEQQPTVRAADIVERSHEIARLEAKISRDWEAYQQRPRKRFIGARTQEFRFARYVEDWRQKIERIGDLNYPQAARDQRLQGRLVVTVGVKADGTVEGIDINRPSGSRILDEAARRIVQLAAPFAPFPSDIAKDTDILYITRTWTFTSADRFISE